MIIPTPNPPSPLDPANGVNPLEKEHSLRLVWEELQVQLRVAVATKDVLALEGGAPSPLPRRRRAVMMDITVDGSLATAVHPEAMMMPEPMMMIARQRGTNRPDTFKTEIEMVAVNAVGNKSRAETIEVRSDHAREARARKTAAPRTHPTFAPLPKTSAGPRR